MDQRPPLRQRPLLGTEHRGARGPDAAQAKSDGRETLIGVVGA